MEDSKEKGNTEDVIWMEAKSLGSPTPHPFYLTQPTEKVNQIFTKYKKLFEETLGDGLFSVIKIGSGAIPGMVGTPAIDIIIILKEYPPTAAQMGAMKRLNITPNQLLPKSPHAQEDTWMRSTDFPPGNHFDEFKVDGKFPLPGHLGGIVVHMVHRSNPWVIQAQAFVEYLKVNEDAFRRYKDAKLEGVRLGEGGNPDTPGGDAFIKYKIHKAAFVKELMNEAMLWKEKNGVKF